MSRANRLEDYLEHIGQAAQDAVDFTAGMDRDGFGRDRRTQQAVVMSLVIVGEAAAKIMDTYPGYAEAHPEVPWRAMRGMRNRIAHGYFEINLDLVWDTVTTALPDLLAQLEDVPAQTDATGGPPC